MPISAKIFTIVFIICGTFIYAHFEKQKIEDLTDNQIYILKSIPEFSGISIFNKKEIESKKFVLSSPVTFVHFWATWCAPCEVEFPEFLKFADSLRNKKIKFILIAINDDLIKVKKFLKQFQAFFVEVVSRIN